MKNDDNSGLRSMFTRKNAFTCDLRKICLDPEMEEAVNQLDPDLLEQEVNHGIQSSNVFPEMQVPTFFKNMEFLFFDFILIIICLLLS